MGKNSSLTGFLGGWGDGEKKGSKIWGVVNKGGFHKKKKAMIFYAIISDAIIM